MKISTFFLGFILVFCLTISLYSEGLNISRDPFYPSNFESVFNVPATNQKTKQSKDIFKETKNLNIKITGIIWDQETPSAIVKMNDKTYLVFENDFINNIKFIQITPSQVLLQSDLKTFILNPGGELNL